MPVVLPVVIVVPTTKPVPADEDVIDSWTPSYDEDGEFDGTTDKNGDKQPLNPV